MLAPLLGGCLNAPILGLDLPEETVLSVERARFDIQAMAIDGQELFISGAQTGGDMVRGVAAQLPEQPTLTCRFRDPEPARRLVRLLHEEALGPVDACFIDLTWSRERDKDYSLEGDILVVGSMADLARRCTVQAEDLPELLYQAIPLRASHRNDPHLGELIRLAEHMPWWTLNPDSPSPWDPVPAKTNRVLALLGPGASDAGETALVVQLGPATARRYVVVPADLVRLLANVRVDPTSPQLRFSMTAPVRLSRPQQAVVKARRLPVPAHARLTLTTREYTLRYRLDEWLFDSFILTPIDVVSDVFVWIMRRGPLAPLFPEEKPKKQPNKSKSGGNR